MNDYPYDCVEMVYNYINQNYTCGDCMYFDTKQCPLNNGFTTIRSGDDICEEFIED